MKHTIKSIGEALANGSMKLDDTGLKNYVQYQADKVLNELSMDRKPGIYLKYLKAGELALKLRGLL